MADLAAAAAAAAPGLDEKVTKLVLRQVEFYFSDSNLPRDNFLKKTVEESEDGLVSLALICAFSRMRKHLELGEATPEEIPEEKLQAVAEALRKSSALKISEDGKRVGRSSELLKPEEVAEQVDSRTVAVSPLPYDTKIEDLETFFGEQGKVNSVRLPRHVGDKRHFCGSALIEFSDDGDAEKVLKEKLVYAGAELHIKPKKDFDAERVKAKEDFEKNQSNKIAPGESYEKGLIIAFQLKRMATEGNTDPEANQAEDPKPTGIVEESEQKTTDADMKEEKPSENVENGKAERAAEQKTTDVDMKEEKPSENVENGKAEKAAEQKTTEADMKEEKPSENVENVKVEKAAKDEDANTEPKTASNESVETIDKVAVKSGEENKGKFDLTREDLKLVFQKFGDVKYIDFQMGQESGYIRFGIPEAAVKARAVAVLGDQGGLVVKNYIATIEALTGDAEKEYWSALRGSQDKRRETSNNNRGRGRNNRGRGRGGRHFEGKRRSESNDGRANKVQKV